MSITRLIVQYFLGLALSLVIFPTYAAVCAPGVEKEWFVKSGANVSIADGSEAQPFAALIDAQNASCPGDVIKIIPVAASVPALNGGIILKDNQKLIGEGPVITKISRDAPRAKITNSVGDAIILANGNKVKNLHIDEPRGAGITAINVTGGSLEELLITRALANTVTPGFPANLCNIVTDASGTTVNNDASNLLTCGGILRPGSGSQRPVKGAINLLNEDTNMSFTIKDVITEDRPVGIPATGRIWQAGLFITVSGHVTMDVDVKDFTSDRSNRGIYGLARDHGKLILNLKDVIVTDTINDGIGLFTGFLCSGIDPTFDLGGGTTCPDIAGGPIPISHAEIVANIDKYYFKGLERPGTGNNNFSMGLEFGPQDQGTSRLEIHLQNSVITQAPLAAIDVEMPLSFLSPDSIIDLGCVDKECKEKGYTSNGNNIFYDNGVNGLSDLGIDLITNNIDLLINGGENTQSNNVIVAQNNYWSGLVAAPQGCISVDFFGSIIQPTSSYTNCVFFSGYFNTISNHFDTEHPILILKK